MNPPFEKKSLQNTDSKMEPIFLHNTTEVNTNAGLEENPQTLQTDDDPKSEFEDKLQETLEKLKKLPILVSEIKLPEVKVGVTDVYTKLCKALEVPISSNFLSNAQSEKLDFSYDCLGSIGIITVTKTLIPCKTVKELDLSYNKIGAQGLPAITALVDRNENITHLNLSNNEIGNSSSKNLGDLIRAASGLESLDLSRNGLGDEEIIEIGVSMMKNDKIRELDLSNNDIGSANGNSFGSSIENCSALEKLDLSNNHFGEGAIGVFSSLKKSNLKYLKFSKNGIPDEAMSVLNVRLRKNQSLEELDLANNCITNKGVGVLSTGLKKSSSLQTLKLAHNPFQGASANTVLSSVGPNLKLLDLTGVKVEMAFIKTLRNLTKSGRDIEVLYGSELRHDCLPRDSHLPTDDAIDSLNVLGVLQKLADEKGVSLRNVLKSIHSSFIIQKAAGPAGPKSEVAGSKKDLKKDEIQQMTKDEFAKRLSSSQISIPKSVAQDIANACSKDGHVNLWELISGVKWRPDDLVVKVKNTAAIEEGKKKGEKSKKKKKK